MILHECQVDFEQLVCRDRTFRLRRAITVTIKSTGGLWIHEYAPLAIVASSPDREASLESFAEEFAALWQEIGQAPEHELTRDAIELKAQLRALLDAVD